MCGIAGVVGEVPDAEGVGRAMARRLHHRGPDASGVVTLSTPGGSPAGVFAHTRLKVVDLSEAAAQPFVDRATGVALVFNGELYDFMALRRVQERAGLAFRSRSDTEVLLNQYLWRGEAGLDELDGMFAFALWDPRVGRLLLGRDRMGKKPLYWTRGPRPEAIAFASEAKALAEIPGVELDLDPSRVPELLAFGYVGPPRTVFAGVHRLPPACRMRFEPGRAPVVRRYWSLEARSAERLDVDVEEAKALVRAAVGRAVERRLVADVPVGAFLSGGIDSSVVVAEMAARSDRRVQTFAVGFDDDATYDETFCGGWLAKRIGTDHTELRVRPDAGALFDRLLDHHDEPYGDSSALAVFAVAEATRQHVTVALTGDGGDEVFGGYTRFRGGLLQSWCPRPVGWGLHELLDRLPEPRGYKHPLALARRFVEHADRSADEQLLAWNSFFIGPRLKAVLRDDVYPGLDPWSVLQPQVDQLAAAAAGGRDRLDQILLHNLRTYLLDDLLVKTDRMTMAVALEARCPFLDAELVELAFRLPSDLKIRRGRLKWILREAYRDTFGPEVLDRKKHGFGVPLAKWWSGPLRSLVGELLESRPRLSAYLDEAEVRRVVAEHEAGHRDHGQRIFLLVQLELFLRRRELAPLARAG